MAVALDSLSASEAPALIAAAAAAAARHAIRSTRCVIAASAPPFEKEEYSDGSLTRVDAA